MSRRSRVTPVDAVILSGLARRFDEITGWFPWMLVMMSPRMCVRLCENRVRARYYTQRSYLHGLAFRRVSCGGDGGGSSLGRE